MGLLVLRVEMHGKGFSYHSLSLFLITVSTLLIKLTAFDYLDALGKSLIFYEGQRSGRLPSNQRVDWRADSALHDGLSQGVDLTGGYYDAGDNVKFGLPMAFTITMLSWSVLEYGNQMALGHQLDYALGTIKWGTDYLIRAHQEPDVLWGEVGDGNTDHYCWQRPEDMTTSRYAYKIDSNNPGSDLAGETAAAMAAASIAFRNSDRPYADQLIDHAKQLFTFANTYRGKYDSSIAVARNFYQSKSGYADELLWAGIWLYEATSDQYYMDYVIDNAGSLGGTGWAMTEFSWDVKYAGVQVLAAKALLQGRGGDSPVLGSYKSKAEFFVCACLQKNYGQNVRRTPGGLMYFHSWNNMQYVTSAAFLLSVYSDYLLSAHQQIPCPGGHVDPAEILNLAKSQIDYLLGNNPRATSYMVGFGSNFPQRVHHRGASIVSYKVDSNFVSCRGGYADWYSRSGSDPNVLVGAVVGGPDQDDNYADDRDNYEQSEPATYNNGPLVGVLARLHGGGYAQLYPVTPKSSARSPPVPVPYQPVKSSQAHHPHARSGLSDIVIAQSMTTSWSFRGLIYYRFEVSVINNSSLHLQQLDLSFAGLHGALWGLSKAGPNIYSFPQWLKSVPPKEDFKFVYIHAAPQAKVNIISSTFA
eukprot:c35080_g1_i1 orf=645-2567(+)